MMPSSSIPHSEFRIPNWAGWSLTPEGAAVHDAERTAVIADVHLGYEWARGRDGDVVPPHSLAETLAKLTNLLGRVTIERLVVAGDLVESPGPCPRTSRDLACLVRWLDERGVTLTWLMGDHDPRRGAPLPLTCTVAGWTIAHGSRKVEARRAIVGHLHPALRAGGLTAPCFLVGRSRVVLPAFSANAAGWAVNGSALPDALRGRTMRCVAIVGDELLDFGPVATLAERLRGAASSR